MLFERGLHPNILLASKSDRIASFIVDQTLMMLARLLGAFSGATLSVFFALNDGMREVTSTELGSLSLLGYFVWGTFFWLINYGVLQSYYGFTVGKFLFQLRVINISGCKQNILFFLKRSALMQLSLAFFFLGAIAYFLNKSRNGIHDIICDTLVIDLEKMNQIVQVKPKVFLLTQESSDLRPLTSKVA